MLEASYQAANLPHREGAKTNWSTIARSGACFERVERGGVVGVLSYMLISYLFERIRLLRSFKRPRSISLSKFSLCSGRHQLEQKIRQYLIHGVGTRSPGSMSHRGRGRTNIATSDQAHPRRHASITAHPSKSQCSLLRNCPLLQIATRLERARRSRFTQAYSKYFDFAKKVGKAVNGDNFDARPNTPGGR